MVLTTCTGAGLEWSGRASGRLEQSLCFLPASVFLGPANNWHMAGTGWQALCPALPSGIRPFLLTSLSSAWVPVPAAPVWQDLSGRGLAARSWALASGEVAVNQPSWKSVLLSLWPEAPIVCCQLLPPLMKWAPAAQREKVWGFSPFCVQHPVLETLLDPYTPCAILEFILESGAVLAERSFLGMHTALHM